MSPKKKARRSTLVLVSLILLWKCSSLAIVKPKVDIPVLCTSADVIVVGRVGEVVATGGKCRRFGFGHEYEFDLWQATITISRLIKGQHRERKLVVEFPGPDKEQAGVMGILGAFECLNPGEMVIVFLCGNGQNAGSYVLANDYRSAIRIPECQAVTRLLEGQTLAGKTEAQITSLLIASLDVCSSDMIENALSDLVSLEGRQAITTINGLLDRCKVPAVQGEALAALIRLGDYTRLPKGVDFLQSGEADCAVRNAKINLSGQLSLVTNAELVARYYIPLLRHSSEFVRRDAAYAVRRSKARIAVPQLIGGLQDSDQEVRYHCLMALAEIFGHTGGWAPSKEVFEKNERDYIGRWQTWWDNGGRNEFNDLPHHSSPQ